MLHSEGSPPADQPLEILCEDHVGTYVIPFLCQWTEGTGETRKHAAYRSRGDRLAGTKTKSALKLEVFSADFCRFSRLLVFDDLPLIDPAEAGSFYRRDVDKYISAAATLRLMLRAYSFRACCRRAPPSCSRATAPPLLRSLSFLAPVGLSPT